MKLALVILLIIIIIACSPACTTSAPEADDSQGLLMCTCGELYMIEYTEGTISITHLRRPGDLELEPGHPFDMDRGLAL